MSSSPAHTIGTHNHNSNSPLNLNDKSEPTTQKATKAVDSNDPLDNFSDI